MLYLNILQLRAYLRLLLNFPSYACDIQVKSIFIRDNINNILRILKRTTLDDTLSMLTRNIMCLV